MRISEWNGLRIIVRVCIPFYSVDLTGVFCTAFSHLTAVAWSLFSMDLLFEGRSLVAGISNPDVQNDP